MRIDIDERRAKEMAKALKKALPAAADATYQQCLDLVARTLGKKSYQHLRTDLHAGSDEAPGGLADLPQEALIAELNRRGLRPVGTLPALVHRDDLGAAQKDAVLEKVGHLMTHADDYEMEPEPVLSAAENALAALDELIDAVADEAARSAPAAAAGELAARDLLVETFLAEVRPTAFLALADAALANDPDLSEIRLTWRLGWQAAALEPHTAHGPVRVSEVAPAAMRTLVHISESEAVDEELRRLHHEHGEGDDALVLVRTADGHAFLFPNDAPESGYVADGGRIGLVFGLPDGVRPSGSEIAGAQTALARRWGRWLPLTQEAAARRTPRIVAHVGEGPSPRLCGTSVDVTDAVLALDRPPQEIRRLLKGGPVKPGWTRNPYADLGLRLDPEKSCDVALRQSAEAFFGKAVELIGAEDLIAARRRVG